jgi:acetyl-CoA acyltransferase
MNIARIVSIKGNLPIRVPAFTVSRNCASGLESITTAANKLRLGDADILIAGGTESMSHVPILFPKQMRDFLLRWSKAKTWGQKLKNIFSFRPSFLFPEIPQIADPLCGLSMGQTAEVLAKEFQISREDQDAFALQSHLKALQAIREGYFSQEIVPLLVPPKWEVQTKDEGPRENPSIEALQKLKPIFDPLTGTVTAGNSSQVTDGAAAVLLMRESTAKKFELKPLGYVTDYAAAGLDPRKMGLGPVYATAKLLEKAKRKLSEIELIEINEAFAAQVLAVEKAFASDAFAQKELGLSKALGVIPHDRLNVNGGAIALGHPLGSSGTRLVITLLRELKRRGYRTGIATLCVGGGQGQAALLEVS